MKHLINYKRHFKCSFISDSPRYTLKCLIKKEWDIAWFSLEKFTSLNCGVSTLYNINYISGQKRLKWHHFESDSSFQKMKVNLKWQEWLYRQNIAKPDKNSPFNIAEPNKISPFNIAESDKNSPFNIAEPDKNIVRLI